MNSALVLKGIVVCHFVLARKQFEGTVANLFCNIAKRFKNYVISMGLTRCYVLQCLKAMHVKDAAKVQY